MSGAALHRQWSPNSTRVERDVKIAEWNTLLHNALPVATSVAPPETKQRMPLYLVEFADFQCGYCARMHDSLKVMLNRSPYSVQYFYANFPLSAIHPHAYKAALSAGCAQEQGMLPQIMDYLYSHQTVMDATSWNESARQVRVPDLAAFQHCMTLEASRRRIEETVRIGRDVGVGGTPSFAVNGVLLGGVRTVGQLERALHKAVEQNAR
jgi:protein-disulfide isomerase